MRKLRITELDVIITNVGPSPAADCISIPKFVPSSTQPMPREGLLGFINSTRPDGDHFSLISTIVLSGQSIILPIRNMERLATVGINDTDLCDIARSRQMVIVAVWYRCDLDGATHVSGVCGPMPTLEE